MTGMWPGHCQIPVFNFCFFDMASIYIYSPSGAVRDKAAFKRAVRKLQSIGHEVEVDADALASDTRFAGTDEMRLNAIKRAANSAADIALITRGGYGLTRLLPDLPYKAIKKSIERGMSWVGFSDFTAFQLAVLAKTGQVTWAGPALVENFGQASPDEITLACFEDLAQGQGEGTGWRMSARLAAGMKTHETMKLLAHDAVLWGGNLAVLSSLVGTPYMPEIRNGILFLEDVAEHPYRIERMLMQLMHAGILQQQKAIVLGQFSHYKLTPHDRGFDLKTVIGHLRAQLRIPVLTDLPFGHLPTRVCLPVGAAVDLHLEGREALILWGHQS